MGAPSTTGRSTPVSSARSLAIHLQSLFRNQRVPSADVFCLSRARICVFRRPLTAERCSFQIGSTVMNDLFNNIKSVALNAASTMMPVMTESKFKETGMVTPDEFVIAGDHLVHHCPAWSWSCSPKSGMQKSYLPEGKQFLIIRGVPCHQRCKNIEYDPKLEKVLSRGDVSTEDGFDAVDDDEGWVDTHHFAGNTSGATENVGVESTSGAQNEPEEDDDEPMDMDAFMESGDLEVEDPNRVVATPKMVEGDEDKLVKSRTYDLYITYDNYYRVPRLWVSGYDEQKRPLKVEEMYEDFSQEHAKKTITTETHPYFPEYPMATIHPCKHADVMKRLIEQLAESGRDLTVHQFLLIFLKFVQAAIPTIEYDYTQTIYL
ncbi:hypothetical protein L596_005446 [Steinernema carpocapsae]|uniref:Ubiquitin-like-conjugating enzyme ATG3 n=1 Tax=Steinernema carpocapsae TaxID=34508 RepID=A0A4U8V0H8_STECR|nr:hypothetical protein L596_005446 [Steinernema carpocapsae]